MCKLHLVQVKSAFMEQTATFYRDLSKFNSVFVFFFFFFFFYRAKLVSIIKLFKWVEIGAQLTYRFSVDFSLLVPFSCFMKYVLNFPILSSGWLQHGMIRWIHIGALFVHRFFFLFFFYHSTDFFSFLYHSVLFSFLFWVYVEPRCWCQHFSSFEPSRR